jgi:hypothetical protein
VVSWATFSESSRDHGLVSVRMLLVADVDEVVHDPMPLAFWIAVRSSQYIQRDLA